MVADRTPSVAASTSRRPCASRPKARRVGSPSTSCRTRPASEPSRRHWRSERRGRLAAEGDHRHRHRQHQRDDDHERQPVLRGHPDQQDDGDDGGRGRLGQVARVVGVERAQPPGGGERQLARALPAQPARPQRQGVLQELAPQRSTTTRSAARERREVAGAVQHGAGEDGQPDHDDGAASPRRATRGATASGRRRRPAPPPARRWPRRSARRVPPHCRRPAAARAPGRRGPGRPGGAGSAGGRALTG